MFDKTIEESVDRGGAGESGREDQVAFRRSFLVRSSRYDMVNKQFTKLMISSNIQADESKKDEERQLIENRMSGNDDKKSDNNNQQL